jgi:hypothetical protein
MDWKDRNRIRVESCIGTIIDVHRSVGNKIENEELLAHFEELGKAIEALDMSKVSEGDILMVEQATNALLGEFRSLFETERFGPVYSELKH